MKFLDPELVHLAVLVDTNNDVLQSGHTKVQSYISVMEELDEVSHISIFHLPDHNVIKHIFTFIFHIHSKHTFMFIDYIPFSRNCFMSFY